MIYYCLYKWLLYMFGIADANFFTSSFGVQTDRFVSKHREADHSFISDDFDTVLTGRIMGNKAPGAAANQSVIKLKASAQCIFGGVNPSAVAFISAGFEVVFRWLCPIEKQSVTNALSANSLRSAQIYFFAMCLF